MMVKIIRTSTPLCGNRVIQVCGAQLTENLLGFYDFTNKVVLFVGAAGRQLLDPSAGTKKLIAIDQDVEGLREPAARVAARGRPTE